jgi:hypothetical protein
MDRRIAISTLAQTIASAGRLPGPLAFTASRAFGDDLLRWSTLALLALVVFVVAGGSAVADQYSSLNKRVAASSVTGLNLGGVGQTTSVEITGSRKNRILAVNASAQQNSGATAQTISLFIRVNGVLLEPSTMSQSCPANTCARAGAFFLDLAQAELANPGLFYNTLPLTIEAGASSTAPGVSGRLSLVAELLKK